MKNINKVHCLFEQSGTFKNVFKKLGYDAQDYDILNEFGETDHQIDLFKEILRGGQGEDSIFDTFQEDDLVLAFFPCVRFEDQILLMFRGDGLGDMPMEKKLQYDLKYMKELKELYELVTTLVIVCIKKNIRLIIENPYSEQHFLRTHWCFKPAIIDRDRRRNGDYYCKPTQYWFLNCEPTDNFICSPVPNNEIKCKSAIKTMKREHFEITGARNKKVARSMIHPDYAERFIKQYILDAEGGIWM